MKNRKINKGRKLVPFMVGRQKTKQNHNPFKLAKDIPLTIPQVL
jgi:hypothetical protein